MTILYLHGLNGSLSPEKRALLERYGKVFSPSIDYEADSESIARLIELYDSHDINVVIGSSMGGFAGYYISNAFQLPALLFNPALAERSVTQNIPEIKNETSVFKHIVLGTKDRVVNPKQTLIFLADTLSNHPNYKVNIHNDLEHRIPIAVFEQEVNLFFKQL